ncbi:MAG: hypothetical protein F4084_10545 [Rhodothermaceae bacterium]|nr:hypothetical protein [Rhodothermaceae bacterium]
MDTHKKAPKSPPTQHIIKVTTPEELGIVVQNSVGGLSPRVMQELRRMNNGQTKDGINTHPKPQRS